VDLIEGFKQGGAFMWPIAVCMVFGATIALERFFFIFLRAGINAPLFMARIQRDVLDGNIEGAVRVCNGEPSAVLPRVVKAGLVRAERPESELRDAIDEAQLEVYPLVNKRLSYMPMIANVSTLFGLLGTIWGLIECFHSISKATAEERSSALAEGIAVAMYATLFGLGVAIPLLIVYGIVTARANALLDEIDHYSLKLVNLLNAVRTSVPRDDRDGGAPILPFRG
jgi:biopolymer transport protein ExbB/TolQ